MFLLYLCNIQIRYLHPIIMFCHNKILLKLKSYLRAILRTKHTKKWKYERTYTSGCLSTPFSCTGLEIFRHQNVIWTPNPILCPNIFIFRNQANANQFSKHRHFLAKFQTLSCIHLIPLHSKTSSQNTVFHEFYRRFRSGFEKSQISWKSKPLMNSGYFMYLQSYQGLWEAGADRNQYRYYCHEQGKWIRIKRSHYSLGFQLLIVMHTDDIFLYADRWRFQPEGM